MAVSFGTDIRRLFTDMDVAHMKNFGVQLDDFDFMRDPDHAQKVLGVVSSGSMPPRNSGEPPWPPERVQLFRDWMEGGSSYARLAVRPEMGQRAAQLAARADVELGEHLAHVLTVGRVDAAQSAVLPGQAPARAPPRRP